MRAAAVPIRADRALDGTKDEAGTGAADCARQQEWLAVLG